MYVFTAEKEPKLGIGKAAVNFKGANAGNILFGFKTQFFINRGGNILARKNYPERSDFSAVIRNYFLGAAAFYYGPYVLFKRGGTFRVFHDA